MKKLFTIFFAFISLNVFCQLGGVGINANGSPPDPSAILDLNSPNKGFLMPRVSLSQRNAISNPALGLEVLDTTTNCVEMYGFGNWQTLTCLCNGAPSTPSTITGNNNPCADAASVTYTVGLVLGATSYTWTVPSDATIIAGQGTNSITVSFGVDTGSVTVIAVNSCGSSSPSALPVSINTIPNQPGSISGTDTICANATGNVYNIALVPGATTYTWTVPSGASVTAGQGTNSATVSFGSAQGNVNVTAGNVCGNSAASVLAIVIPVNTGTQSFYYTGSMQSFTVPYCVTTITIEAWGAQGGNGYESTGGLGADMKGTFSVNPGDVLTIGVGAHPADNSNSGGGGGSSGVKDGNNILVVAGGGGGGGYDNTNNTISNAVTGTSGQSTYGCGGATLIASGGTGGSGGGAGTNPCGDWPEGAGGAGVNGDGGSNNSGGFCGGGSSLGAGGSGNYGSSGGFGFTGGGGASYGGGGGGGYSGGAGGASASGYIPGGGGGSYNAGTNQTNIGGAQLSNGQVTISW